MLLTIVIVVVIALLIAVAELELFWKLGQNDDRRDLRRSDAEGRGRGESSPRETHGGIH